MASATNNQQQGDQESPPGEPKNLSIEPICHTCLQLGHSYETCTYACRFCGNVHTHAKCAKVPDDYYPAASLSDQAQASAILQAELARLRAENERIWGHVSILEQGLMDHLSQSDPDFTGAAQPMPPPPTDQVASPVTQATDTTGGSESSRSHSEHAVIALFRAHGHQLTFEHIVPGFSDFSKDKQKNWRQRLAKQLKSGNYSDQLCKAFCKYQVPPPPREE